jgi:biotin carboxyl carrier protein
VVSFCDAIIIWKMEIAMKEEVIIQVPGNVWKVLVKEGDQVKAEDVLFILEVMKTEVPHAATVSGTVRAVHIVEGQEGVDAGIVAVEIA